MSLTPGAIPVVRIPVWLRGDPKLVQWFDGKPWCPKHRWFLVQLTTVLPRHRDDHDYVCSKCWREAEAQP